MQPTVNGPRCLPVNAHVYSHPTDRGLEVKISFYTIGTAAYLGSADLNVKLYLEQNGSKLQLENEEIQELFAKVPLLQVFNTQQTKKMGRRTWLLERQIWADRWQASDEIQKDTRSVLNLEDVEDEVNDLPLMMESFEEVIKEWRGVREKRLKWEARKEDETRQRNKYKKKKQNAKKAAQKEDRKESEEVSGSV